MEELTKAIRDLTEELRKHRPFLPFEGGYEVQEYEITYVGAP